MKRPPAQLRRDALQIWQAGVDAVRSERLVREALRLEGSTLLIGDEGLPLAAVRRIAVVGAGKAGAGMAAAVEEVLGPRLMHQKQLAGWVNVPADCAGQLTRIKLHAARSPIAWPARCLGSADRAGGEYAIVLRDGHGRRAGFWAARAAGPLVGPLARFPLAP